jgi:DNA-directed RNA polymerase I, II, and III subunit RPABC3
LQCRLTEEGYDMHLDLDVNTDLWPLELGERFTFALASTLSLDGAPDTGAH